MAKSPVATATAPAPARTARAPRAAAPAPAPAAAPAPARTRAPRNVQAAAPAVPETQAEPKVRISASSEELDAAVAGTLQPRETVGTVDQASLVAKTTTGKAVGRPIGLTTGLPIMLCWCYVYQQNEKAPPKDKMTDNDISEFMKSEFPGRAVSVFEPAGVNYCRRLFNAGRFTKDVRPQYESHRYDENGAVVAPRTRQPKEEAEPAAPTAPAAPRARASATPAAPAAPAAARPAPARRNVPAAPAAPAARAARVPARA